MIAVNFQNNGNQMCVQYTNYEWRKKQDIFHDEVRNARKYNLL
jgi:hypothetical protein